MNKLLVSGASYAMCNWDIKHWAEIIAEENDLDTVFTGIPWSDWESGVFISAGRIMNDPKITHCIWTATYHFISHYQEHNRVTGKELIDFDNQLQIDAMRAGDFNFFTGKYNPQPTVVTESFTPVVLPNWMGSSNVRKYPGPQTFLVNGKVPTTVSQPGNTAQ